MKTEHREMIQIPSNRSGRLTVEIDSEVGAAYVRLKDGKVARTVVHRDDGPIVTIDLDSDGNVLGIEFIGVDDFTIDSLLKKAPTKLRSPVGKKTPRYIRAPKAVEAV
jgi:uncharacterized protein YuzE